MRGPFRCVAVALFVVGCAPSSSEDDDTTLDTDPPAMEPPALGEGFQVEMTGHVAAYTEAWTCAIYHLPTTSIANVNRVQWQQTGGTHHMTLSTVLTGDVGLPDGQYDCDEVYQDDFMKNQVMFFGNQGSATGELALPPGIAATLPASLQVVHELHYVNALDHDIDLVSRINAYTIADDEVTDGIWGGSVRDEFIQIPASATEHTEWTRCVMNRDVEVHFLASHSHRRGERFTIARFDGTTTGEVFFENTDWHDPLITQYDPPLVVKAGEGFEFSCTWRNDDPFEVNYGLTADDEMCNMAIVHTPFDPGARCEVVESSDGHLWAP